MRDVPLANKVLAAYSILVTTALGVMILTAFAAARNVSYREITVERINIVEPDGALRMVIANKALFPGIILKGKEHPHPNRRLVRRNHG
jgi:hypothetical protein